MYYSRYTIKLQESAVTKANTFHVNSQQYHFFAYIYTCVTFNKCIQTIVFFLHEHTATSFLGKVKKYGITSGKS